MFTQYNKHMERWWVWGSYAIPIIFVKRKPLMCRTTSWRWRPKWWGMELQWPSFAHRPSTPTFSTTQSERARLAIQTLWVIVWVWHKWIWIVNLLQTVTLNTIDKSAFLLLLQFNLAKDGLWPEFIHAMKRERAAALISLATAKKMGEVWIGCQPALALNWFVTWFPTLATWSVFVPLLFFNNL